MGTFPKLRDLTWEPAKIRPALYLQKPDRRVWTWTLAVCDVRFLDGVSYRPVADISSYKVDVRS